MLKEQKQLDLCLVAYINKIWSMCKEYHNSLIVGFGFSLVNTCMVARLVVHMRALFAVVQYYGPVTA